LFSALKMFTSWRGMNKTKKNVAAVAISYLGILRPNGALGMCLVAAIAAVLGLRHVLPIVWISPSDALSPR